MLSVDEALAAILESVEPGKPTRIALGDALGLVLADDVISGIDSPPFDKSLMDGYAVRSADVAAGEVTLRVIEEVTAGRVSTKTVGGGEATRIMTGAPIPAGADAVVPSEQTRFDAAAQTVHVIAAHRPQADSILPGKNVMHRGTSIKRGDCILQAGRLLRPQELGALAELGEFEVFAHPQPRVAVLATGDELVRIDQTPGPGQIRNSNETMLTAQIRRSGAEPVPLGIARDDRTDLRERISAGLQCDVLLLSGGVSAGKLDLVPSELEAAGVRQVFHKVHLKPGKPIWYGVLDAADDGSLEPDSQSPVLWRRHVFGLPGNPVSSLVCFELFARTGLRRLMGIDPPDPRPVTAKLAADHIARGDRPTYHPARLELSDGVLVVRPIRWHGSADLRATVEANAMALFPAGDREYAAGESVDVIPWDDMPR